MRGVRKVLLTIAAVVLLTIAIGACGGGGSDDSTAATTEAGTAPTSSEDSSSGEGSASFRTPSGDNSIQNYGEEADTAEVDAATAALSGYMEARAKDAWAQECTYLAKSTVAPLVALASRSSQLKGKGCAAILAALAAGTPASLRANTLTGPIASLRFRGDRGFALYHGAGGVDYFVPMTKEDSEWKVGALSPTEFP